MKCKVSKKDVVNNYTKDFIITLGYCDLQEVLSYYKPFAYSSGTYGWGCDYYDYKGYCISTGYAPIDANRLPYEFIKSLESEAHELLKQASNNYEDKQKIGNKILDMLIKEVCK